MNCKSYFHLGKFKTFTLYFFKNSRSLHISHKVTNKTVTGKFVKIDSYQMPEGHDTTIEVSNNMSFVLYTQILKQSVLKPASPGIALNGHGKNVLHEIYLSWTKVSQNCQEKVFATWNKNMSVSQNDHGKICATWNMSFLNQSVPKWLWTSFCYMKYVFPESKCPKMITEKFVLHDICLPWIKVSTLIQRMFIHTLTLY